MASVQDVPVVSGLVVQVELASNLNDPFDWVVASNAAATGNVRFELPMFDTVTVCGEVVVPAETVPKFSAGV